MTDEQYKTVKESRSVGWWWSQGDDNPCYGPHDTEADARNDYWDSDGQDDYDAYKLDHAEGMEDGPLLSPDEFKANHEFVMHTGHCEIHTGIFSADHLLEDLEDKNEDAVYGDFPPEWPKDKKRDLELMLADTLYKWMEMNDLWKEFRGLK